jgi:HEPN domain-containing protein
MNRDQVVQIWALAGVKDFYISFEFEDENKWHEYSTFFCHQGLEKICKAYVIASKAGVWEKLPEQQSLQKVDEIAKTSGHELYGLIETLLSLNVLSRPDKNQVDILEKAYIEARYPVPNPLYKNYPLSKNGKMLSDPMKETAPIKFARKTAVQVIHKLETDFKITIPRGKLSSTIEDDTWKRFTNVFFELL